MFDSICRFDWLIVREDLAQGSACIVSSVGVVTTKTKTLNIRRVRWPTAFNLHQCHQHPLYSLHFHLSKSWHPYDPRYLYMISHQFLSAGCLLQETFGRLQQRLWLMWAVPVHQHQLWAPKQPPIDPSPSKQTGTVPAIMPSQRKECSLLKVSGGFWHNTNSFHLSQIHTSSSSYYT